MQRLTGFTLTVQTGVWMHVLFPTKTLKPTVWKSPSTEPKPHLFRHRLQEQEGAGIQEGLPRDFVPEAGLRYQRKSGERGLQLSTPPLPRDCSTGFHLHSGDGSSSRVTGVGPGRMGQSRFCDWPGALAQIWKMRVQQQNPSQASRRHCEQHSSSAGLI